MGLNCYACGGGTQIDDTRTYRDEERDFVYVIRRHRCLDCGTKFKGMETYADIWNALLTGEEDGDPGIESEAQSSGHPEGDGSV